MWVPNLMPLCGEFLEPRGSKLRLLKSTFNAKNFTSRPFWSICNDFGAIHYCNVCHSWQSPKITITLYFVVKGCSRSLMFIILKRLSAVFAFRDKQKVYIPICNHFHSGAWES